MPEFPRATLLERFQRAQALVTDRVDAVEPGQWAAPALPGSTVADLVAHLTALQWTAVRLLAGDPVDQPDVPAGTDALLGDDPLTAWEAAADEALAAWAVEEDLSRTLELPDGPAAAGDQLTALTTDLTVHAWDLAHATGGDTRLDAELVEAALASAGQHVPAAVGPSLSPPPDADPLTRLLARFGRRP